MDLLSNAIQSIALAVDDFDSSDHERLLSCTRNLIAGILLLFKHKLSTLSPADSEEVLVKEKILPFINSAGELQWKGRGRKTVNVQQIRERFKSLDISVDWERINKINEHRNDIEHYYSTLSSTAVEKTISDSFIVIQDFIRRHLEEDPKDLLGEDVFKRLLEVSEVYDAERNECEKTIKKTSFTYSEVQQAILDFECSECGSGLIELLSNSKSMTYMKCRSCDKEWDQEDGVEEALIRFFRVVNYRSFKDTGEDVVIDCPECGREAYSLDENICYICEASVERECGLCGMDIPASELDGKGLCGYCAHMWAKDD